MNVCWVKKIVKVYVNLAGQCYLYDTVFVFSHIKRSVITNQESLSLLDKSSEFNQ